MESLGRGYRLPFLCAKARSQRVLGFNRNAEGFFALSVEQPNLCGHCLLILDIQHATRPNHISTEEWVAFCTDVYVAERMLMEALQPGHINVEIMGNVVPHLHWQIVPRYRTDPRWGAPIWTTTKAEMPMTHLPAVERTELVQNLRIAVGPALK